MVSLSRRTDRSVWLQLRLLIRRLSLHGLMMIGIASLVAIAIYSLWALINQPLAHQSISSALFFSHCLHHSSAITA